MSKLTFCFVILHYKNTQDTVECVDSILSSIANKDYKIIIVDNGSPNQSGKELASKYSTNDLVKVILSKTNCGYAVGNNIGYSFAKKNFNADFIIVLNNDTIISQTNFLELLSQKFSEEQFHVCGPDIINLEEKHQNPHRNHILSLKEVNKKIRNQSIIKLYCWLKLKLPFLRRIQIVEHLAKKDVKKEYSEIDSSKEQDGIVLQGSCLIFSPLFTVENNECFLPDTFLYFEEEILAYICKKKNYIMRYIPDIKIKHKEGASTKTDKNSLERFYFETTNLLKSAKVLRRVMTGNVSSSSNN